DRLPRLGDSADGYAVYAGVIADRDAAGDTGVLQARVGGERRKGFFMEHLPGLVAGGANPGALPGPHAVSVYDPASRNHRNSHLSAGNLDHCPSVHIELGLSRPLV